MKEPLRLFLIAFLACLSSGVLLFWRNSTSPVPTPVPTSSPVAVPSRSPTMAPKALLSASYTSQPQNVNVNKLRAQSNFQSKYKKTFNRPKRHRNISVQKPYRNEKDDITVKPKSANVNPEEKCGGQKYNMSLISLEKSKLVHDSFKSRLVPVDDVLKGNPRISNKVFDFKQKKMQLRLVILIYLYGFDSNRYQLTEYMFAHYKKMQSLFKDYADITYTIVGSENDLSKNLTTKYFPEESYYEFDQNNMPEVNDTNYVVSSRQSYEIIRRKVNYGMRAAYTEDRGDKPPLDIIFWVGSNDYISLSFWRQVIEDYNPTVMKWYGLTTYFEGRNVVFFTKFDGRSILDRKNIITFFANGKQPYHRLKYQFIGPVNGITRLALDTYPAILDYWNHDEGEDELFVLNISNTVEDPRLKIYPFESHECFTMNMKGVDMQTGQDVTPWMVLKNYLTKLCPFEVSQSRSAGLMSKLFLSNFDKEFLDLNDMI